MLRPEVEAIVSQNNQDLIPVFRQWMNLDGVLSPEARLRWEIIKKNRLPDIVQGYIDKVRARVTNLAMTAKYDEAVILAHQEISEVDSQVSGEYHIPARSVLYRLSGSAQAIFAVESGLFPDLDRENLDRSRVYISAAVDGLRADVERGVITAETGKTAEAFGFAGMPKIQYAIWQRVTGGVIHELRTRQVPRTDYIAVTERRLLEGRDINFRGLRIS